MTKLLLLLLLLPTLAAAQPSTCVGTLVLDYPNPPTPPFVVGDVFHVRGRFGSGDILGGTVILFNKIQFDLDCDLSQPLTPPCTDAGPVFSYNGDASITTTCGVTWTSNNPGGGLVPNEIEFDSSPVLPVPPHEVNPPGLCEITFDVTLASIPPAAQVGQILGYKIAFCDNGLTSGGFQTAAGQLAAPLQHYDCYQTPRGGIPLQPVTLVDRFGTMTATLTDIHRLCAPADKNGENPGAENDPLHYTAFTIKQASGFTPVKGVTIRNQFGTYTGDVAFPLALLVPASKGLTGFLPSLDGEHFACYRLRNVHGPAPTGIHVVDQFVDFTVDVAARGPHALCVGATKNGANGGTDVLMCLNTRNDRLPFNDKDVFVTTQFGQKALTITQYDELCVPATIQ